MLEEEENNISAAANNGTILDKQVFIIGSRRSGTTWTLWLLANHPSMVGVQHSNLIDAFKRLDNWWQDEDRYHSSIVSGNNEKNKSNLKDFITSSDFYLQCSQLMNTIFSQAFKEKTKANVLIESQPENIDHLELLMNLFPDAYYLHVIRDPRAVFSSWKTIAATWSSPDIFQTHPVNFCKRWQKDITVGRSFANRAKNYREIKYEELQNEGVSVLQGIYRWLDVDASGEIAREAIDACEIQKLRKKANMPEGFFRKGLSEGWRTELSASEIKCVEYLLADSMDDLGYQRVNKGKIATPYKISLHNTKNLVLSWIRNTFVFNVLRKVSHRIIG